MRLKEDTSSWRSRGIQRRMYRQAPLAPDEETTRHRKSKKGKKKHVHDWKGTVIGTQVRTRMFQKYDGTYEHIEYTVPKTQYVCTGCGNKRGHSYGGW